MTDDIHIDPLAPGDHGDYTVNVHKPRRSNGGQVVSLDTGELLDGPELKINRLIKSSREFVSGFIPPDPLIEGIISRRYIYALTGHTGRGKTALALLFAAHVALAKKLGNLSVERGRVLILAGENPVDVQMRWIAMAQQMDFDRDTIDVHFIDGVHFLSTNLARIRTEIEAIGGVDFVIVDSSAAHFEGDDENSNAQQGAHARQLRQLISLKGGPAVLVLAHPPKNAGDDSLQPRGGGAYVAEIDGNLTVTKDDLTVTLHWQTKLRGPDFAPVSFLLRTVTHEELKSTKGKLLPTVVAECLTDAEQENLAQVARSHEDELMKALAKRKGASMAELAIDLGWLTKDGNPYKSKVQRLIHKLKQVKLVADERGRLILTDKGRKTIENDK